MTPVAPADQLHLREARAADVPWLMELVAASEHLHLHTEHTYWVLIAYGGRYVLVAEDEAGRRLGFISALRSTRDPGVLFVWQLAVAAGRRERRVAYALARELIARGGADGCRSYHATVADGNAALRGFLETWAQETGWAISSENRISYETTDGEGRVQPISEEILAIGPRS